MTVKILLEAEEQLIEASHFLESRRPGLGSAFLQAFSEAAERLKRAPQSGPRFILGKNALEGDFRYFFLSRFQYLIIYELMDELIVVHSIVDARRDLTQFVPNTR